MADISSKRLKDIVQSIVIEAGELVLQQSNSILKVEKKTSSKDVVTRIDKEIEAYIIKGIKEYVPDAKFIGEESLKDSIADASHLFIIDPIDGTSNFVVDVPYYSISVAYYRDGKPTIGFVYNPCNKDLYCATVGEGATLNDRSIKATNKELNESLVIFETSPYNLEKTDETFDRVKMLHGKCRDLRLFGSAALDICLVADGSVGLFFAASLSLWDYAAAQIILSEAGGTLVNFSGEMIVPKVEKTSIVAGNMRNIIESGVITKLSDKI